MSKAPLDEPWNWTVLTRACPACGSAIPEDQTERHRGWHWLTNTEPRKNEVNR